MRSLRGLRGRRGGRVQQYVAVVPIVHNGVRAYNVGYPVPVSNVEKYGYLEQGLVRAIGEPAPPAASTTPILRLSVRCKRRQLLAVYDVDPPILLGFFAADVLRLQDADVVAPGPVHLLAWLRAGRAAADFVESVIADAATPLQLWCPNHKQGHDLHPGLLRAELSKADKAHQHEPRCSIERVERASQLRRNYAAEKLAEYVTRIVAEAPPLTRLNATGSPPCCAVVPLVAMPYEREKPPHPDVP